MIPTDASRDATVFSRRAFLRTATALGGGLALASLPKQAWSEPASATISDLPMGAAPTALTFDHFPDRMHAFVWRNWPLVPLSRIAQVVSARAADIERMGRAMGLGKPPRITREQQARSYITVIKRNWHLLPYEQLVALLGWTTEQLAYALREDDFLFIKLGNLKPKCAPLRYEAPSPAVLLKEEEIAHVVREEFPAGLCEGKDPLFSFVSKLSRKPFPGARKQASGGLKFCYSYFALYGDPLLGSQADPYPAGYLARLAELGVNGVWLQAVLHKLAPFPWQPQRSIDYQKRLNHLHRLVSRAGEFGIKIFLYLNEPRAMPLAFFEKRPELKGTTESDYAALCTSVPEVQQFLVESVAGICSAAPGLGGFFTITASENLTNCWSHGGGARCPRCAKRSAAAVIAEVNALFLKGISSAKTSARLIAWDWGWDDGWAAEAIDRVPDGISIMSVSEWRLPIERGGIKTEVGEYSISAVGPGPRAQEHWQLVRQRGLKTIAKIQAGNTWELSSVPFIPAVENVARHAENLHRCGVGEFMLGWTLGGYPSHNLEVVSETLASGSAEEGMRRVAERRFGSMLGPSVLVAWRGFSAAFREFPFHVGVVYSAPQQLGPANLLWGEATGFRATMVGFPYDDLENWCGVYPPAIFVQQFEKVAEGFERTLAQLRESVAKILTEVDPKWQQALEEECAVAEAAAIHFRSTANQARFVISRSAAAAASTPDQRQVELTELKRILSHEIVLARRLHGLQCGDARIGFEASNHYFYVPVDLAEKVLNCRDLLRRL